MSDKRTPWRICSVKGGWDGICDAGGRELFKLSLNDPEIILVTVKAVNAYDSLLEAVSQAKALIISGMWESDSEISNLEDLLDYALAKTKETP